MQNILRIFLLAFTTLTVFFNSLNFGYGDTKPSISGYSAILIDYETGKVLYEKNANKKIYPASTTKIWTAYVVLKHIKNLDEVVNINYDLKGIYGSAIHIQKGESFTVRQLLEALLVRSANDAAVVLANHVSGSVDKFAKLMNDEAKKIGTNNTNFTNANGLPDELHTTTASDMALMAKVAMNNSIFRNIVKMKSVSFKSSEFYPYERIFDNTNQFLTGTSTIDYKGENIDIKYDIVDGIKTGFTDEAGRCLISSATNNNMRLICAVFKSDLPSVYIDSRNLLDYGFENFKFTTIVDKNNYEGSRSLLLSKEKKLVYYPKNNYSSIEENTTSLKEYTTNEVLEKIKLPIKKNDVIGNLEVYKNNNLIKKIPLLAKNNVNPIFSYAQTTIFIVFVFILILFIFLVRSLKRRKLNRKYRRYKSKYKFSKSRRRF